MNTYIFIVLTDRKETGVFIKKLYLYLENRENGQFADVCCIRRVENQQENDV